MIPFGIDAPMMSVTDPEIVTVLLGSIE